ncbi:MAG: hypothetical protein ABIA04_06325 [Pseudomonadota bacterium]
MLELKRIITFLIPVLCFSFFSIQASQDCLNLFSFTILNAERSNLEQRSLNATIQTRITASGAFNDALGNSFFRPIFADHPVEIDLLQGVIVEVRIFEKSDDMPNIFKTKPIKRIEFKLFINENGQLASSFENNYNRDSMKNGIILRRLIGKSLHFDYHKFWGSFEVASNSVVAIRLKDGQVLRADVLDVQNIKDALSIDMNKENSHIIMSRDYSLVYNRHGSLVRSDMSPPNAGEMAGFDLHTAIVRLGKHGELYLGERNIARFNNFEMHIAAVKILNGFVVEVNILKVKNTYDVKKPGSIDSQLADNGKREFALIYDINGNLIETQTKHSTNSLEGHVKIDGRTIITRLSDSGRLSIAALGYNLEFANHKAGIVAIKCRNGVIWELDFLDATHIWNIKDLDDIERHIKKDENGLEIGRQFFRLVWDRDQNLLGSFYTHSGRITPRYGNNEGPITLAPDINAQEIFTRKAKKYLADDESASSPAICPPKMIIMDSIPIKTSDAISDKELSTLNDITIRTFLKENGMLNLGGEHIFQRKNLSKNPVEIDIIQGEIIEIRIFEIASASDSAFLSSPIEKVEFSLAFDFEGNFLRTFGSRFYGFNKSFQGTIITRLKNRSSEIAGNNLGTFEEAYASNLVAARFQNGVLIRTDVLDLSKIKEALDLKPQEQEAHILDSREYILNYNTRGELVASYTHQSSITMARLETFESNILVLRLNDEGLIRIGKKDVLKKRCFANSLAAVSITDGVVTLVRILNIEKPYDLDDIIKLNRHVVENGKIEFYLVWDIAGRLIDSFQSLYPVPQRLWYINGVISGNLFVDSHNGFIFRGVRYSFGTKEDYSGYPISKIQFSEPRRPGQITSFVIFDESSKEEVVVWTDDIVRKDLSSIGNGMIN